jgi:hypothetical protein
MRNAYKIFVLKRGVKIPLRRLRLEDNFRIDIREIQWNSSGPG